MYSRLRPASRLATVVTAQLPEFEKWPSSFGGRCWLLLKNSDSQFVHKPLSQRLNG